MMHEPSSILVGALPSQMYSPYLADVVDACLQNTESQPLPEEFGNQVEGCEVGNGSEALKFACRTLNSMNPEPRARA